MRIIKRFPLYFTCALLLVALLAGGAARGVEADMTKAAGSATEPRTAENSGTAETETVSSGVLYADAVGKEATAETGSYPFAASLEPGTSAADLQTLPEDLPDPVPASVSEPRRAVEKPSDDGVQTPVELFSGLPQKDRLRSADDVRYYRFVADARGAIRYSVSAAQKADLSGRIVSLYQIYYLNGMDGEKGVRLLNYMQAYTTQVLNESPNIGVLPGEYLLAVQAGAYVDLGTYEIRLDFIPGTDYEIECNDAPSRYTEVFSGVPVRGSASPRQTGTDADWFMIRMHQPGALSVQFAHAPNDQLTAAFRVAVYTDDMRELYSGLSAQNLALLESGALGVPAGAYFVCVESRVAFVGDYALTVTKEAVDLYEKEPNDTSALASQLFNGRPVTGALSARQNEPDKDCYRIDLPQAGLMTLTLSADPVVPDKNDPDRWLRRMTLTDGAGRTLSRMLMLQSEASVSSGAVGLAAGVYYVQIDHDDLYDAAGAYTLQYTFAAAGSCEREFNDASDSASPIGAGVPCIAALQDRNADPDTDWFRFTLERPAAVTLRLTYENGGLQDVLYRAVLHDAALAPVADENGGETLACGGASLSQATYRLAAGDYYVRVTAGVYAVHTAYAVSYTINEP